MKLTVLLSSLMIIGAAGTALAADMVPQNAPSNGTPGIPAPSTPARVGGVWTMDTNHDNAVSEQEFLDNSKNAFQRLDKNGDGKLTGNEVPAFQPMKK